MTVTIENLYTGNGSTTNYSFTFPYLDEPDIKASLDGVVTTNFRLLNATTVQFVNNTTANTPTAPGNGVAIRIYRETAYENPKATFYPGAAIRAGDLNDNTLQNLYVNQESNDKVADAWLRGDQTIISSEAWHTSDDTKVGSTKAIENRINSQIDSALTDDVIAGSSVTIADNTPSAGKITVSVNASSASATGSMSSAHYSKLEGIEANATADQTNAEIRTAVEAATDSNVFTDADHSKLNAIEASATADQTDAEIKTAYENNSDTNAYTDAEKTKLSGIEASATADQTNAEIRTAVEAATDSNVFTDADHTKLNGIEASATADQTAAEIKTAYESNAQTNPLTDAEKAVIDGVTANTSELNKLDGVTASTTNLNIVSGKTFRASGDGTLSTTSDTEIPSSKVIASHVASAVSNVGGFVTIANEVSFPTTANQPANGVIVSISDAAGTVVNGSGVSTTGRTTDGTPATVTINNFPSSLNSETLASGVALLVTSTGSSNTYNYHKILAAETDVKQLSDDINDFNARYRVAGSAPGSNNDDGDLWFDTAANKMKVYNATGSSWDDVASVGQFFINTISSSSGTGGGSATFNGSAYRFTLSNPATGGAAQLLVSVNGVVQKPNAGSSQPSEGFAIDGNDIIFAAAPASGSDFHIITQGSSVSIGTPSANSVNSSHIIDGSIVNADISNSAAIATSKLSGAVTGIASHGLAASATTDTTDASNIASGTLPAARIGNDSIVEGKLDVHNAPATDKYLKYTSNGMEWSDGASEGTDVKSTGESGTTKFLRVDGDGTCSWQVPPDTNTQVGGATGVDFNDSTKIRIGAGNDLELYHDGNSYVTNTTANQLAVQSDDLKLRSYTGLENYLTGTVNGAVDVFFNGVKKLETTSTGINVTGAINVNGAALSTAPTITATASGSIAAGAAVILNANGTVSTVTETAPATGTIREFTSDTVQHIGACFNRDANIVAVAWRQRYTGNCKIRLGTISGDTISWGSESQWRTSNIEHLDMAYDSTNKCYGVLFTDSNGFIYFGIIPSDGTTTVGSMSSLRQVSNNRGEYGRLVFDPSKGSFTIVQHYRSGGSGSRYAYIKGAIFSSNTGTPSGYAQQQELQSPAGEHSLDVVYDPVQNKSIAIYGNSNGDGLARYYTINNSGSASLATARTWLNGMVYWTRGVWDTKNNKLIIVFNDGTDSEYASVIAGTPNGDNFTWSSIVNIADVQYTEHTAITFNEELGTAEIYAKQTGNHDLYRVVVDCSGSNPSITTAYTIIQDNNGGNEGIENAAIYDPNSKQVFNFFSGDNMDGNYVSRNSGTTTLTSTNFLGFSSASYTNGQTATINIVGNTSTQSSLTTGTKYYLQKNGSLGTSPVDPSVEAGLALSSTKILIKG